jgi:hypothetical protein
MSGGVTAATRASRGAVRPEREFSVPKAFVDLAQAVILSFTATLPRDIVSFGAAVKVKDLEFGDEETFTLVGAGDEDYQTGKILLTSPIGQGLPRPAAAETRIGVGGVFGPGVARVATAHLGADGGPAAGPETRQVLGQLDRAPRGRQQG